MKSKSSPVMNFLKTNYVTLATMFGVIMGVIVAAIVRSSTENNLSKREVMYIGFVGDLFLRTLKSVIIPLIIPSLIVSVGTLDLSLSGKVGGRAVLFYIITTIMAVVLGIVLVTSIQPGASSGENDQGTSIGKRNVTTVDTMLDLVRNCFPPNIIEATVKKYRTELMYPGTDGVLWVDNYTSINGSDKHTWNFKLRSDSGSNILGLIVFSTVVGIAIAVVGDEGLPLLRFFESLSIVMMKITVWIIHVAPIGVFFLILGNILMMKDFADSFRKLGLYFVTVLAGLLLHGIVVLPTLYAIVTRSSPIRFVLNMGNALITAFGTSSSSATLPITIQSLEEKNKVDSRIARFVLPIGATINMDGTALYEAVAAIFIAQYRGIALSFGNIVAISITATAASIGAAGIPQAGIVTMVMVLDTVGLPSEDVGLILAVDWLLDRCRTAINVLGDSICAGIIYHLSTKELKEMDEKAKESAAKQSIQKEAIQKDGCYDTAM